MHCVIFFVPSTVSSQSKESILSYPPGHHVAGGLGVAFVLPEARALGVWRGGVLVMFLRALARVPLLLLGPFLTVKESLVLETSVIVGNPLL